MTLPQTTAIIGLGLMGGSLARDLAAKGTWVVGYDRDQEVVSQAMRYGAVHAALDDSLSALRSVDLVVVALPVDLAPHMLTEIVPMLAPDTIVTDLGSTKRAIVEAANDLGLGDRFVGSHPLAGDHRSGWPVSREGLYHDVPVYLSPAAGAAEEVIVRVEQFWRSLGARPERIDAEEHDRRMAWVSHLPQLLSTGLANTLSSAGWHPRELGPGGRDMTRLAGSSPQMWTGICIQNADLLRGPLTALLHRFSELEAALADGDESALRRFFSDGRDWLD
jgi:prephenate dehydrogenase